MFLWISNDGLRERISVCINAKHAHKSFKLFVAHTIAEMMSNKIRKEYLRVKGFRRASICVNVFCVLCRMFSRSHLDVFVFSKRAWLLQDGANLIKSLLDVRVYTIYTWSRDERTGVYKTKQQKNVIQQRLVQRIIITTE